MNMCDAGGAYKTRRAGECAKKGVGLMISKRFSFCSKKDGHLVLQKLH